MDDVRKGWQRAAFAVRAAVNPSLEDNVTAAVQRRPTRELELARSASKT